MSLIENQNIFNTLSNVEFGIFLKVLIFLKIEREAGDVAQLLGVLFALAEVPSAVYNAFSLPLTFASNCSSRGFDALYWPV